MASELVLLRSPQDFVDQRWANGGGVTRELLRIPSAETSSNKFLLRLSIATVGSSGPFSFFPGVDRTLVLLNGKGMILELDSEDGERGEEEKVKLVVDTKLQKICFRGETPIHCELLDEKEVEDFNLMADREEVKTELKILRFLERKRETIAMNAGEATPPDLIFLYVVDGAVTVQATRLPSRHVLVIEPSESTLLIEADEMSSVIVILARFPRYRDHVKSFLKNL